MRAAIIELIDDIKKLNQSIIEYISCPHRLVDVVETCAAWIIAIIWVTLSSIISFIWYILKVLFSYHIYIITGALIIYVSYIVIVDFFY